MPVSHEASRIERPRRLPPNASVHFVNADPETYAARDFGSPLKQELRNRHVSKPEIVIWVHCCNSTKSKAVLRLAQCVDDSGYDGMLVLCSWALAGKVTKYVYDRTSALAARKGLGTSGKMSNVVLASPDIDLDVFATQLRVLRVEERGFYVLVCVDHAALEVSGLIAGRPRLGQAKENVAVSFES